VSERALHPSKAKRLYNDEKSAVNEKLRKTKNKRMAHRNRPRRNKTQSSIA